nr:MAG TPA: hypothetical protein [Caudoviricetes sp.]
MKIIDSNGNPIEAPDLTKGYLKPETQTIHHDAVEGVEEVWHHETATLPDGTPAIYYDETGKEKGRDVVKVVDVPAVKAQEAYDEEVEVQRYILYTAEELAAQEKARKEAEEKAQLPTAEERLAALEAAMLDLLASQ